MRIFVDYYYEVPEGGGSPNGDKNEVVNIY